MRLYPGGGLYAGKQGKKEKMAICYLRHERYRNRCFHPHFPGNSFNTFSDFSHETILHITINIQTCLFVFNLSDCLPACLLLMYFSIRLGITTNLSLISIFWPPVYLGTPGYSGLQSRVS